MLDQVTFFAEHLPVEQPGGGAEIDHDSQLGNTKNWPSMMIQNAM
jgi:hypothetical protein